MAQGFRRTGSTFSQKGKSSAALKRSQTLKKGARVIAPKRSQAQAKAALTAKLTATLNRRAESALITRIGHEETSLRMVKADPVLVEELKSKNKVKKTEKSEKAEKTEKTNQAGSNSLIQSAIDGLNGDEAAASETGSEEEEVFTEDEAIPLSSSEETDESDAEAEK